MMQLYESGEDYLETILMIEERKGTVHSIDIAEELSFSKASVSVAMKKLRENGYIKMDRNGVIHLLEPGRKIAERIYERHKLFTRYFVSIGVDEQTAADDACRVEHDLSDETYQKLKVIIEKQLAE